MAPESPSLLALGSDAVQRVLALLPLADRAALLATTRALHDAEPLVTAAASFCGACEPCRARSQHLCAQLPARRTAAFWVGLLRASRPAGLSELRLAGCDFPELLHAEPAEQALRSLRVLDLHQCPAFGGGEALARLAELTGGLVELHLRDMAVDSAALAKLLQRNAATLRVVDLLGCHTVSSADVRAIAAHCVALRDLSLWGCHNVDNAAIVDLVRARPALRRLNLRYVHRVDDHVVAAIAQHLPKLKELNLRYCFKVSDAGVAMLCDGLPLLERLNLSQCSRISDVAIARIAASLGNLKELRLWGCSRLTSAAVRAISTGLPALALVDLRSRDRLESVIGGQLALKFLIQTYRNTLAQWEQALGEQDGVFKRPDDALDVPV